LSAVDDDRARFVCGSIPEGWDLDDAGDREKLLSVESGIVDDGGLDDGERLQALVRRTVLEQVATDRPPAVWVAAQRLLALGQTRSGVLVQLTMAFTAAIEESFAQDGDDFDEGRYLALLDTLPVPDESEIAAAVVRAVRSSPGLIGAEALADAAVGVLGCADNVMTRSLVAYVIEDLLDEEVLAYLPSDQLVHVGDLCEGIVLTRRLTTVERELGVLDASFDLAPLAPVDVELHLPDGRVIEEQSSADGQVGWHGPAGWLESFVGGTLLSVRVDGDGTVEVLPAGEVVARPGLVARARAAYDTALAGAGLPVEALDLVLMLLAEERDTFSTVQLPLSELCEAAGLEVRADSAAHDEAVWEAYADLGLAARLAQRLDDEDDRDDVRRVVQLAAERSGWADRERLRHAVGIVADEDLAVVVADELAPPDGSSRIEERRAFCDTLRDAARRPEERAGACWLAAVVAERDGDLVAAEGHLGVAVDADPEWEPALERAAWYASDRGDASRALRLWRRLEAPDPDDIATIERFARPPGGKLGRNDACWCGSGRKHKLCHLGRPAPWPLADRVEWLCHKAVSHLRHRGGEAMDCVFDLALAWAEAAGADDDAPSDVQGRLLAEALADPLVTDAALVEGGWFEAFLAERGPLLPDDEALLARSWTLVPRTVYEIEATTPGTGVAVRDLRSGERFPVRERTFSQTTRPGVLVCGRAVSDGEIHQFVGGLFPVDPGTEGTVLDLCDRADGPALCSWIGARHRPPRLMTRENEPIVNCRAIIEIGDPAAATAVLNARYEALGPAWWHEMHPLDHDESILRTQVSLEGDRLTITTNAEERLDRVLALLSAELATIRIVSEVREPLAPGEMPPPPRTPPTGWDGPADPAANALAATAIVEALENRWLDEAVPALAGLTPRQAAADPTRRSELERLLDTYPEPEPDSALIALRPDRLRTLLGLATRKR
jgi:hypothetical protein